MSGMVRITPACPPRLLLIVVLVVSSVVRMILVLHGGQFFWLDESFRFHPCLRIIDALRYPNHTWTEIADTIARQHLHTGFLLVGIPATIIALELMAFLPLQDEQLATALVLSLMSVACIALVYALARRLDANRWEALLAAFLMASANSMFYYSRHVLPYDSSLALVLFTLWWGLGERRSIWRSVGFGVLAGTAYLIYFGYLTSVFAVTAIYLVRDVRWRTVLAHGAAVALGFIVPPVSMHIFTLVHGAGMVPFLNDIFALMQLANQGGYEEGWRVPWDYLWLCEHGLLVVWAVGVVGTLVLSRRGWEASRTRGILWVAAAAMIYAQLAINSTILHKAVVLGRFARQLVPFLCLATAAAGSDLSLRHRRVAQPAWWMVAVTLISIQTAANFAAPLTQHFSPEVEQEVAGRFSDGAITRDISIVGPELREPVDRSARYVLMNTATFLYPAKAVASPTEGRVLLRYPHPLQFLPYQYEVYDAPGRSVLQAADISMRLIDTWDMAVTPR